MLFCRTIRFGLSVAIQRLFSLAHTFAFGAVTLDTRFKVKKRDEISCLIIKHDAGFPVFHADVGQSSLKWTRPWKAVCNEGFR